MNWIKSFLIQALYWLHTYPSVTCFALSADIIHLIFLVNLVLIIILHAIFTAYPHLFLEIDDSKLKIFIYVFNISCMIIFASEKWTQSFCGKSLIHKISDRYSFNISADEFTLFKEGSVLTLCLCLLAGFAVLLSKAITITKQRPTGVQVVELNNIERGQIAPSISVANERNMNNERSNSNESQSAAADHTQEQVTYNLDAVGLYMIVATIVFIILVRLAKNLEMNDKLKDLGKYKFFLLTQKAS